jgi:N-acetylmuramoyl-L-alanine amidase
MILAAGSSLLAWLLLRKGTMDSDVDVMVDPGHGGKDSGAVNPDGTLEKDLNLDAALTLKYDLVQHGLSVGLTRSTDVYVELEKRVRMAEERHAKLFVSVHHDIYTAAGGGAYYNQYPEAEALAKQISRALDGWCWPDTASRFGRLFIRDFHGPAILIELGPTVPENRKERMADVSRVIAPLVAFVKGPVYA